MLQRALAKTIRENGLANELHAARARINARDQYAQSPLLGLPYRVARASCVGSPGILRIPKGFAAFSWALLFDSPVLVCGIPRDP